MGTGLCSRCPKVGREPANEKSPSHPSYCKVCIKEYNQSRYRKQTSMKDFVPLLNNMVSELALTLSEDEPDISVARQIVRNLLGELKSFRDELEEVTNRKVGIRSSGTVPTLQELVRQYYGVRQDGRDAFKQMVIHRHYPGWEPEKEAREEPTLPDDWDPTPEQLRSLATGFQITGPPPKKSE